MSYTDQNLSIERSNIEELLAVPRRYYEIPNFQRPYTWEVSDAELFMEDVENMIENPEAEHYFGSVISVMDGKFKYTIIDGQQRVTTATLMLTAVYHLAKENPGLLEELSPEDFANTYLHSPGNAEYGRNEARIKLRTVTVDNQIFGKIFERRELSSREKASRLNSVYRYFYDHLAKVAKEKPLDDYWKALERFRIADITLGSRDDPQRIFESINSTGRELKEGDKIRNFALMLKDDQIRDLVYREYWTKIEQALVSEKSNDELSDFFRTFLIAVYYERKDQNMDVYRDFKKYFAREIGKRAGEEAAVRGFYGRITNHLNYYMFLKTGADEDGKFKKFDNAAFRLRYLKVETPFPFLMRVLDEYMHERLSAEEVLSIFKMTETYLVRRMFVGLYTTSIDKMFYALHRDISHFQELVPGAKYTEVLAYILRSQEGTTAMPTDEKVRAGIRERDFYKLRPLVRNFVLYSINEQGGESLSLRQITLDEDGAEFTIEHVMPQTLNDSKYSKEWRKMLGEEGAERVHEQYLHTLPNLTLTAYNSEYSNRPFSGHPGKDKKTLVKDGREIGLDWSGVWMNAVYFRPVEKWDEEEILKRAEWYDAQIAKLWPLPETDFKPPFEGDTVDVADDVSLLGRIIVGYRILGTEYAAKDWISAYREILAGIFAEYPQLYEDYLDEPRLRNWILQEKKRKGDIPLDAEGHYFINDNLDNDHKLRNIRLLLDLLPDEAVETLDIKLLLKKAGK